MTPRLMFAVHGIPQPKGSARAFVVKSRSGRARAAVVNDNPKGKGWQQLVAEAASRTIDACPGFRMIDGPIRLVIDFALPRPKDIKARAVPHTKKPDLDKLIRCVADALTGVAWPDDSRVVAVSAEKAYAPFGQPPGAVIRVFDASNAWPGMAGDLFLAPTTTKPEGIPA